MPENVYPLLGAFLIGLSKAGFATGLGMLTTPLLATAMTARHAIGVVLPLLCFADLMTIAVYWKKWRFDLIRTALVGALFGIALGMLFVNSISDRILKNSIGVTGMILVALLLFRSVWFPEKTYRPSWWEGCVVGFLAGFASTISHGAGPIIAIFLLAQKPDKQIFVASSAIFFTLNNLMKVPPYVFSGLITRESLTAGLFFLPIIPVGVLAGWVANRLLPQKIFTYLVYILLFLTSLQLILT